MKFHIPNSVNEEAENKYINSAKELVINAYPIISDKKIQSVTFKHNGEIITDIVGKQNVYKSGIVLLILESIDHYVVFTEIYKSSQSPYSIIWKNSVKGIGYFDD